jgi:hypothetical protein
MKLFVQNTARGLVPMYDEDYEEKRKLKIGKVYEVKIRLARNYEFHKKYFSLITCAWEYQNEKTTAHFKNNIEMFRKTIEIAAGNCDSVYSIARKEWIEIPKSIAFENMDEAEFQELYERVKDVLFSVFLKNIKEEEFMINLANY